MRKHNKIFFLSLILFLLQGLWAQQKEKPLSLEDCIMKTMRNNLSVAVEVLNPELADISVSRAISDDKSSVWKHTVL
jgi:hypothetical protein